GLRGHRARRCGELHAVAGAAALGAGYALRARGRCGLDALRAHRRPAEDPGRDRQGLRRHPGADPPDRVQDDVQAAASEPVPGAAGRPRLLGARFGTDCPPAQVPGRDRQGLRPRPGAAPPDRVRVEVEAAASGPVPGAAGLPRLIGARFGTDCPPARAPIRALSTDWALSTDPGLALRLLG